MNRDYHTPAWCNGCHHAGRILDGHFACSSPSEKDLKAIDEGRAYLSYSNHDRNNFGASFWAVIYDKEYFYE